MKHIFVTRVAHCYHEINKFVMELFYLFIGNGMFHVVNWCKPYFYVLCLMWSIMISVSELLYI